MIDAASRCVLNLRRNQRRCCLLWRGDDLAGWMEVNPYCRAGDVCRFEEVEERRRSLNVDVKGGIDFLC